MIANESGANDDCICLAVSGRQTSWSFTATQPQHFDDPLHRPSGDYARSLGEGVSRFGRGHLVYQTMGHTAVFVRRNGLRREPVVGFFPKEGMLGSLTPSGFTAKQGGAVEGAWHDDGWMFNDQAALSYEVPCSGLAAVNAHTRLLAKMARPETRFQYQTRQDPGDDDDAPRNCVAAAMVILEEIATYDLRTTYPIDQQAEAEVWRIIAQTKQLLAGRGFLQGQMQQLVQTGFTHLPPSGG